MTFSKYSDCRYTHIFKGFYVGTNDDALEGVYFNIRAVNDENTDYFFDSLTSLPGLFDNWVDKIKNENGFDLKHTDEYDTVMQAFEHARSLHVPEDYDAMGKIVNIINSCARVIASMEDSFKEKKYGHIENALEKFKGIYNDMKRNKDAGNLWPNIRLLKKAYELMKAIPDEIDDKNPYERKADLLFSPIYLVDRKYCPHLCLRICRYCEELYSKVKYVHRFSSKDDNDALIKLLRDFVNPDLTMEDYCALNNACFFDPVERTKEWEIAIFNNIPVVAKNLGRPTEYGKEYDDEFKSKLAGRLSNQGIDWNPDYYNTLFDDQDRFQEILAGLSRELCELETEMNEYDPDDPWDEEYRKRRQFFLDKLWYFIDELDQHYYYVMWAFYSSSDNLSYWTIDDPEKFRRLLKEGVDKYDILSPEFYLSWDALADIAKHNNPAILMDDLEEFYDILCRAVETEPENEDQDVRGFAKGIKDMIWESEK